MMTHTTHVLRVVLVVAALGVGGLAAQRLLKPESFGEVGHYRKDSVYEIMSHEPVHQGREACAECHEDIHALHDKDIHYGVECEDCHGPGNLHVRHHTEDTPTVSEEEARMPMEYTLEGCLFCHRKLAARPTNFPQIDPTEHYKFLHVTDKTTRCIECHSPHEPIYLLAKVNEARIHPVIRQCEDCHDGKPEKDHREVEGHPVIFTCRDCHKAIVEDFETHEHAFMDCTACHLFHAENENAGRIFKNGNGKFCLLCHEKKPFKHGEAVPQIVSSEHLAEMAPDLNMTPEEISHHSRACLDCHFDFIHDSELIKKGVIVDVQ